MWLKRINTYLAHYPEIFAYISRTGCFNNQIRRRLRYAYPYLLGALTNLEIIKCRYNELLIQIIVDDMNAFSE